MYGHVSGGGAVANRRPRCRRPSLEEIWDQQARRLERELARFSVSYMSDTKWRKALRALAAPGLGIRSYRWKFVDDQRIFTSDVVREEDLEESHLRDGGGFQPYDEQNRPASTEVSNSRCWKLGRTRVESGRWKRPIK